MIPNYNFHSSYYSRIYINYILKSIGVNNMIKLISVGNPFMKDDGIAVKVIEEIREKLTGIKLDIIVAETDYQNGFYLLNEGDFVIILDAMYTGTEPGNVCVFDFKDVMLPPSPDVPKQPSGNVPELPKMVSLSRRCVLSANSGYFGTVKRTHSRVRLDGA